MLKCYIYAAPTVTERLALGQKPLAGEDRAALKEKVDALEMKIEARK